MKIYTHCTRCKDRRFCNSLDKGRGPCKDYKEDKHETQDAKKADEGAESED